MILLEQSLEGLSIGSLAWFEGQKSIIKSKPLLKHCYDKWYKCLLEDEASVPQQKGAISLELGSGGSYLKELQPGLVTSDIVDGVADKTIDARHLPFADNSVRAIFMTHAFHHVPDVELFLAEAERVLIPGGVISLIEVAHTPLAKFIFSNFHTEPYDDRAPDWKFNQADAMADANQALSWVVFVRDRKTFQAKFPNLTLERTRYLPWFGYLASGGVTRKAFLPKSFDLFCRAVDFLTRPLGRLFSLHWALTIRKSQ